MLFFFIDGEEQRRFVSQIITAPRAQGVGLWAAASDAHWKN